MTRVLGPELVPAGFTIFTEACVAYLRDGAVPEGLGDAVDAAIERLERRAGRRFGDPADLLLVSVRRIRASSASARSARSSTPGRASARWPTGASTVSGVRTPLDLSELASWMPEAGERLREILRTLERHYRDMQDTEFTI
jgi:phosphoenolpyruvate synthase/pyruvate phosphate dikinase